MNKKIRKQAQELEEKLNDPEVIKVLKKHLDAIQEIVGLEPKVDFMLTGEDDEFNERLSEDYEGYDDFIVDDGALTVGELSDLLNHESRDLKLVIDPIKLKNGLNSVLDVFTTTFEDDKLVMVFSVDDENSD
jgi:hypothetical protein